MMEDEGILAILGTPIIWEEIRKTSQLPEIEESFLDGVEDAEIEYKKPRDYREKTFEDTFCNTLDQMDIQYERQKRVRNGVIDIFIYGQPPIIIEVKKEYSITSLMQAAVQLKFYADCFTSALLYVTAPDILNERNRAVLRQFGIGEAKWIFIRNPEDPVSVEYDPLVHKLGVEYL